MVARVVVVDIVVVVVVLASVVVVVVLEVVVVVDIDRRSSAVAATAAVSVVVSPLDHHHIHIFLPFVCLFLLRIYAFPQTAHANVFCFMYALRMTFVWFYCYLSSLSFRALCVWTVCLVCIWQQIF